MSSKDLYEQSSSNFNINKGKATQTSKNFDLSTTSNTKSTRPLPQNSTAKPKDGNVKVFEFCEIIQDPCNPDSVSIIKESFSEEVITETPKGFSIFPEKPTAKKYIYCREVTQSNFKTFSSECPFYVTPTANLVQKPVEESKKPDCQSNQEVYSNNNSIQAKINSDFCVSAMNSDDKCKTHCKTTFINPEDFPKKCPSKTDQNKPCQKKFSATKCSPIPKCSSKENQEIKNCECPKSTCQQCYEGDESKLKCCISLCMKKSAEAAKKASVTCVNETEKLIGIKDGENCEDKPTYYLLEKPICPKFSGQPNDSPANSPQKSNMQTFFDSQSQTVATIQCALKDLISTVCTKTKEAVEVLKSNSSENLNIKSKSATDKGKDVKDCANVINISSFIPKNIKDKMNRIDISTSSESLEQFVKPAKSVLDQVASIVMSSISIAKDTDFKKLTDDILEAKFNKSSPLDQPGLSQKIPKPVTQEHKMSSNSSIFTTIKSKLFSIFGQDCQDDDVDDEFSAEKYFDKYCDQ